MIEKNGDSEVTNAVEEEAQLLKLKKVTSTLLKKSKKSNLLSKKSNLTLKKVSSSKSAFLIGSTIFSAVLMIGLSLFFIMDANSDSSSLGLLSNQDLDLATSGDQKDHFTTMDQEFLQEIQNKDNKENYKLKENKELLQNNNINLPMAEIEEESSNGIRNDGGDMVLLGNRFADVPWPGNSSFYAEPTPIPPAHNNYTSDNVSITVEWQGNISSFLVDLWHWFCWSVRRLQWAHMFSHKWKLVVAGVFGVTFSLSLLVYIMRGVRTCCFGQKFLVCWRDNVCKCIQGWKLLFTACDCDCLSERCRQWKIGNCYENCCVPRKRCALCDCCIDILCFKMLMLNRVQAGVSNTRAVCCQPVCTQNCILQWNLGWNPICICSKNWNNKKRYEQDLLELLELKLKPQANVSKYEEYEKYRNNCYFFPKCHDYTCYKSCKCECCKCECYKSNQLYIVSDGHGWFAEKTGVDGERGGGMFGRAPLTGTLTGKGNGNEGPIYHASRRATTNVVGKFTQACTPFMLIIETMLTWSCYMVFGPHRNNMIQDADKIWDWNLTNQTGAPNNGTVNIGNFTGNFTGNYTPWQQYIGATTSPATAFDHTRQGQQILVNNWWDEYRRQQGIYHKKFTKF